MIRLLQLRTGGLNVLELLLELRFQKPAHGRCVDTGKQTKRGQMWGEGGKQIEQKRLVGVPRFIRLPILSHAPPLCSLYHTRTLLRNLMDSLLHLTVGGFRKLGQKR